MQSSTLVPVKDIVFTDFEGGEAVLVDLNTTKYYQLNETGALIWRRLENGCTMEEIVSEMQSVYDVSSEHAVASVERLLLSLESNKLLKRA
jgi:hypothetical protein